MASTTATLFLRPTIGAQTNAARSTGAVVFVPMRIVSGPFSSAGITRTFDVKNLRSWLPPQSAPVCDAQFKMTPVWYRFFNFFVEVFLGGADAPTLPDIAASVSYSEAQSIAQSVVTAAMAQMNLANAQALATTIKVVQESALPGADQIPGAQLQPNDSSGGGGGD